MDCKTHGGPGQSAHGHEEPEERQKDQRGPDEGISESRGKREEVCAGSC